MTQPNNPPASTPVSVVPNPVDTGGRQNTTPAVVNPESRSPQAGVVDATPTTQQPAPPQQQPVPPKPPEAQPQQQNPPTPAETVEMERFKAVQQIARQNEADARAYREMLKGLGVTPEQKTEFDPKAEIEKLRKDVEDERTERAREHISHTTNVPVDQITGKTPEEMQASAERAMAWVNSILQQANVPAAVPASVVNSQAGPNDGGPAQIESREELAKLSNAERMAAFREGRCDKLLGKR